MSPALADAINLGRVQGIDSSLGDLTLRDGRQLAVEIGGAIVKTPRLSRTISGGSSVSLEIHDHDLDFLDVSLLAEKFDAELDGLHFRQIGQDLGESGIALTLKDRDIAILEETTDPIAAYRKDTTRARFCVGAVKKVRPNADITCPEIDVVQPIKTERQGKKAAEEAKATRGKGIGETKGLTVKGVKATPKQIEVGERAARAAASDKAPFRVAVSLFLALIVEGVMGKYSNYLGLEDFIPIASDDLEGSVHGYLRGYDSSSEGAIEFFAKHPVAEPFEITQAIQRSGAGKDSGGADNYGPWTAEARAWVEAFEGGEFSAGGAGRVVEEPYVFEFEPEKDKHWWGMIKRLAKEVNWRAFWINGRFFFIDEIDLMRGMVRLAIDRDTPGIQKITGSWRHRRPTTEITVTAFASDWKVPPGGVVTLAGYGAFSVGLGDPPVRGGIGVGPAHSTEPLIHRARYLVDTIESPLRDSDVSELRKITIKLRKPTAPLLEPAATKKTISPGATGAAAGGGRSPLTPAGAPPQLDAMLAEMEALEGKPYDWGGGHDTVTEREAKYDCSGAMSRALYIGGYLDEPLTSGAMASRFEAGKGEWFVIWANDEHVFCEVKTVNGWVEWEEGGVKGDCGFLAAGSHPKTGFTPRHPKGL